MPDDTTREDGTPDDATREGGTPDDGTTREDGARDEAPREETQEGEARDETTSDEAPADRVLDELWKRVLATWDEDKVHGALLEYALREERLPDVAGRYRALLDDPEKGPRAKKRIDAIVLAATQLMMATKTQPRSKPPAWLTSVALVVSFALIMLLTYSLVVR